MSYKCDDNIDNMTNMASQHWPMRMQAEIMLVTYFWPADSSRPMLGHAFERMPETVLPHLEGEWLSPKLLRQYAMIGPRNCCVPESLCQARTFLLWFTVHITAVYSKLHQLLRNYIESLENDAFPVIQVCDINRHAQDRIDQKTK
jgi:hypothetical protein